MYWSNEVKKGRMVRGRLVRICRSWKGLSYEVFTLCFLFFSFKLPVCLISVFFLLHFTFLSALNVVLILYTTNKLRARLVVRGFPNLDNHKTRVAAGNRNNLKLRLWGIFKL